MKLPRRLDFVAPARPRPLAWLALALGLLAWAGAVAVHVQWNAADTRVDELRAQLAERTPKPVRPNPAATAAEAVQWRDAEAAARDLAAEWGPLLQHLAQNGMPDVAVTQLEPDPRSGQLQIAGMAATPEAALAYAGRLAAGKVLTGVMLVSHEASTANPPPRLPVQFRVQAHWRLEH